RREKLHQGPDGGEYAIDQGTVGAVATGKVGDQTRQHWNDDPERNDVDKDRDENEDHGGATRRGNSSHEGNTGSTADGLWQSSIGREESVEPLPHRVVLRLGANRRPGQLSDVLPRSARINP